MDSYNTEAVIKLGEKCIEDMTAEYLARYSEPERISYQHYLKRHLASDCWLRSVVDPDEIIACMDRVRRERLKNDEAYKAKCLEEERKSKMDQGVYVIVVPKNEGDFRPCILEYGISLEKASEKVKWYIKDHGLKFKKNGKIYPALIQIHKVSDKLPDGYYVMALKEIKKV